MEGCSRLGYLKGGRSGSAINWDDRREGDTGDTTKFLYRSLINCTEGTGNGNNARLGSLSEDCSSHTPFLGRKEGVDRTVGRTDDVFHGIGPPEFVVVKQWSQDLRSSDSSITATRPKKTPERGTECPPTEDRRRRVPTGRHVCTVNTEKYTGLKERNIPTVSPT